MQDISAKELKARLDAGEKLHIIDVREPSEYAESRIEGSLLLPLGQVMSMDTDAIDDWKDEELIMQCRSGKRSAQAGMMLETMGFSNVKNLVGGILAWQELN